MKSTEICVADNTGRKETRQSTRYLTHPFAFLPNYGVPVDRKLTTIRYTNNGSQFERKWTSHYAFKAVR